MLTESGARTDLSYLPSNPLARAGAYVVDWYIACVLTEIAILLTDLMLYREILNATGHIKLADDAGVWENLLLNVVALALLTGYFAVIPGMIEGENRGQTLGMRLFKLKVVADDYSDASIARLFLRGIVWFTFLQQTFSPFGSRFQQLLGCMFTGSDIAVKAVAFASAGIGILSCGMILFSPDRLALHDRLSRTRVICVKKA